jgi:hypothetical protein
MMHWKFGMEEAMKDVGITISKEDVVHHLWKCGWEYDEATDTIRYDEEE